MANNPSGSVSRCPSGCLVRMAQVLSVLCLLVGIGILLPLGMAVVAILNLNRYGGSSGGVLKESIGYFVGELKPNLSTVKVPKLLSVAAEYIQIPYRREHEEPVRHLLAALRNQYDIKEPKFQRRHPSVIKAHMLILAQACRKIDEVDSLLEGDLQLVLAALPRLWDEALKLTLSPYNQLGHCHLRPALSFLEFSQCFTQAVSPSFRKGDSSEGIASLLQLPHVDERTATLLAARNVDHSMTFLHCQAEKMRDENSSCTRAFLMVRLLT